MPTYLDFWTRRGVVFVAAIAWLAVVASGFFTLELYEKTPGPEGSSVAGWPVDSSLSREMGRPNVVAAVHPLCPCSRASLEVLADIVRQSPTPVSVRLLIFQPEEEDPSWDRHAMDRSIAAIAGAVARDDPGGVEAKRFGLATSGAVAAFDSSARKRFAGGLTARRSGPVRSAGADALTAILQGRLPGFAKAPVFGCPLRSDDADANSKEE